MRIAYGVHGYSRGHATRAAAILPSLMERHQVQIYAGGDAYAFLRRRFPVQPIPSLGFSYNRNGRLSKLKTLVENLPRTRDLFGDGPSMQSLKAALRSFAPDVVVSDAEPWTHRAARALGIPRIGFDHFGVMVYCRVPMPPLDRARSGLDRAMYRTFIGRPDRVLVSSFYDALPCSPDVQVIGPLLRDEVYQIQPRRGEHLLVYLNNGARQLTRGLEAALQQIGMESRLYGGGRVGQEGNITFRAPGNRSFLRDLASCQAVISTAGNQLVGEALHYGKPLLVMPEQTVEQRLNAAAVVRMGVGQVTSLHRLSAADIYGFLSHIDEMAAATRRHVRDGRRDALALLERWFEELAAPAHAAGVPGAWVAR